MLRRTSYFHATAGRTCWEQLRKSSCTKTISEIAAYYVFKRCEGHTDLESSLELFLGELNDYDTSPVPKKLKDTGFCWQDCSDEEAPKGLAVSCTINNSLPLVSRSLGILGSSQHTSLAVCPNTSETTTHEVVTTKR